MNLSAIIFDLDDTLYPASTGVWSLIRDRIDEFMVSNLNYTAAEAPLARQNFFRKYGTTLRGLQYEHHIDPAHYLKFVHDIPIQDYIKPNPALKRVLSAIRFPKYIFTNSDRAHTARVLSALEISEFFDEVVDVIDVNPYCKPMEDAFRIAFTKLNIDNPSSCMIIEDSLRNLQTAKAFGMQTVWLSDTESNATDNGYRIQKIEDIGEHPLLCR